MRALSVALVGALASCCDDPAPPPAADAGLDAMDGGACYLSPPELAMGTGSNGTLATYQALADGDPVYLVPGPQGQHIWIGLRGRGFDPALPRVEMRAYRPSDGALIGRLRIRLPMVAAPEDPTLYALPSQTLTVDDRAYCSVLGGDVRIELDFDDLRGHCRTLRRTVRLADIDPATPETVRASWRRCCDEHLPRCYAPPDGGLADASTD